MQVALAVDGQRQVDDAFGRGRGTLGSSDAADGSGDVA